MRLHATVTRLLGAAIVLLAAYLSPSLAHAHEGHGMPATVAHGFASSMAQAHGAGAVHSSSPSRIVLGSAERPAPPKPGSPCHRDCCNPGMICCLSALVVEPTLALPLPTIHRQVPLRAVMMPPGRMPEALPKPPRAQV